MLFNSYAFAIFLPIVFFIYWAIPHKARWILLLIASYYFYMCWNPKYVVLIFGTTVVSYVAALLIDGTDNKEVKKIVLTTTVIVCMGVLFLFKYFNFTLESISSFLGMFAIPFSPVTLKLLLPVGISFYTFQTMSYVIDVYRGNVKAEKHFGYYATFISFFPQLVAGPIERTSNLLPQIKSEKHFDYEKASYGIRLMVWGFFKKLVVADNFSVYVDRIFNNIGDYQGSALLIASFLFTIQIYCDFSGYSDIAIGTAKLMGVDLIKNFNSPYFSASVKEFWQRWHISLSTWFRDYVYIPLGGNRCSRFKHNRNLLLTFLVSGIWHGANWTFVVWGGIHGIVQILESSFLKSTGKKELSKNMWWLRVLLVFVFCDFAWIFFRANSIMEALYAFRYMFVGLGNPVSYLYNGFADMGLTMATLILFVIYLCILCAYDYYALKGDVIRWIGKRKKAVRYFIYFMFLTIIMCCRASGEAAFVYFQF